MKLKYCAFTGPDDAVDPKDLAALSKEYPFVEWSILYLPGEQGTPRSPTTEWIEKFSAVCGESHTCLHLCLTALPGLVEGDKTVLNLIKGFDRIQMNFEYLDAGRLCDPATLAARCKSLPQWEFILQYGRTYKNFLPAFRDVPNHAVLFDGSAGEGVSPFEWPAPLPGHACGYAGGINPDNVKSHLEKISKVTPADYSTWIDMETGMRTEDKFDLTKVRRVLEIAKAYV